MLARVQAPSAGQRAETFDLRRACTACWPRTSRSRLDVPPADNSEMDGYALRCADVAAAGAVLPVSQRIPAGVVGAPLAPGSAARIFTGAQVPPGADAVVMQEQCTVVDGGVRVDVVPRSVSRSAGAARTCAAAPSCCAPASACRRRRSAWRRRSAPPRCGWRRGRASPCSRPATSWPCRARRWQPGAIYNSNRFTLRGLIEALGGICEDLGIVPDRLDATREALRRAAEGNDADRHLRRHLGRRGRPPEAGRREAKAGSTSGRSR